MAGDELLEAFEEGGDMGEFFDFGKADRPNREVKRVNIDFPLWMLDALDNEADRLAISRQAVVKTWVADRLRRDGATA